MRNNIFLKQHLRGSSGHEEAEKNPDQSLSFSFLKQRNRQNESPADISDPASDHKEGNNDGNKT